MSTAFEQEVLLQLGSLQEGQKLMTEKIEGLEHKLEGNGQPGLIPQFIELKTNCAAIQRAKTVALAKGDLHWVIWVTLIAAILSPVVTAILEIFRK